ncbi:thioredoxin family protein [Clostridiisalibacter paucivorans]|uniref:thioredoxin family protein n=1 Tax=Clostridiisalibacter paucivorans TaxID=408753 RepID=UPI00047C9135|nr:thioredoxin family protein [Clostridiisalibacter paucivorans]
MEIKILGGGCTNCKKLEQNTEEALRDLNIKASINKVEDFKEIMKYGVMKTPALVVNEQVLVKGRVPKVSEIKKLLK